MPVTEKLNKYLRELIRNPIPILVLLLTKKTPELFRRLLYFIGRVACILSYETLRPDRYLQRRSSVPWIAIIANNRQFIKISWRKNSIYGEYANSQNAGKSESVRQFVVRYSVQRMLWYYVCISERKMAIGDEEILKAAEYIISEFGKCGRTVRGICVEKQKQLGVGLKVIDDVYGETMKVRALQSIEAHNGDEMVRMGPAHGDFHPRNIVKDADGKYFMIDWDCFRKKSIQQLDPIYFVNEYYAARNGVNWYRQLLMFIEKRQEYSERETAFIAECCPGLNNWWLLLYFVDRLGQERAYVSKTTEMPLAEIDSVVSSPIFEQKREML